MIFRAMDSAGVKNVKEVINVGDTTLDLQSEPNTEVVGVLTGARGRESLEQKPHTHIMDRIAELPDLIMGTF